MVQHHQTAQIGQRLVAKKRRQPDQRFRVAAPVGCQAGDVVIGAEVGLVKRKIQHHGPGTRAPAQALIGHLAHVFVEQLDLAGSAAPVEFVAGEQSAIVGNAQLGKQRLAYLLAPVARIVNHLGGAQDGFNIHAGHLNGHDRVLVFGHLDLADFGGPVPAFAQHILRLAPRNRRLEGAVVQRRQPQAGQRLERLHLRHQRRQQQRLEQPRIVAQVSGGRRVGLAELDGFFRDVVLGFEHGQQPLAVQALGVVKMQPHAFGKRLVAFADGVVQVAHRDQLAQLQIGAPVHQQLHHQLQGCALALQRRRHGNQRLNQRWREGINLLEHLPIRRGGQQRVQHLAAHRQNFLKLGF